MIKFVLAVVAVVFVGLAYYAYTDKPNNIDVKTAVTEKEPRKTEKVSVVAQDLKEKKSSIKNIMAKSPKIVSKESNEEMENEMEIGEDLTLEGIENTDLSDEKKEEMLNDLAYSMVNLVEDEQTPTEEEILKTILEDENNLNSK